MALAVAAAIAQDDTLVVEAGTGVGKTYAYLVPVLMSGVRALISTATKTLQDQLFERDLPHVARALGLPLRAALLKGRSNYLCLHRLEQTLHDLGALAGAELGLALSHKQWHTLQKIQRWSLRTATGDLSEIGDTVLSVELHNAVSSTRENCLGSDCPRYQQCHVQLARREAMAADIVVVNHHLVFADLMVRESGIAELLPSVRVHVFDEAHQINEIGIQFLGRHIGTQQMFELARDTLAVGLQQGRGLADWPKLAGDLEQAARAARLCAGLPDATFSVLGQSFGARRLKWEGAAPDGLDVTQWQQLLRTLIERLQALAQGCESCSAMAPDFARLIRRAEELRAGLESFFQPCEPEHIRWLEVDRYLRLTQSPLGIGNALRQRAMDSDAQTSAESLSKVARSWIFTSATLGEDAQLSWFTQPCALADARILRVQSPFDYATQAALWIPRPFPAPSEDGHVEAVVQVVLEGALALGGRTLVLAASLKNLRRITEQLRTQLGPQPALQVLCQGEAARHALLAQFSSAQHSATGAILVASAAFRAGVDIPGAALQLVVLDKLPFPMPDDPLVQARERQIKAQGGNPFTQYHLREASVMLRQSAGRLIRRISDQGLLCICDPRLIQRGYGKPLLASLPPMQRLNDQAAWLAALAALARANSSVKNDAWVATGS